MHHSIDIKSVLIGALLAALVLCLIGAVPRVMFEEQGRFKIESNDSHAFILDSATGQVWSAGFAYNAQFNADVFPFDPEFHAIKISHEAIDSQ